MDELGDRNSQNPGQSPVSFNTLYICSPSEISSNIIQSHPKVTRCKIEIILNTPETSITLFIKPELKVLNCRCP